MSYNEALFETLKEYVYYKENFNHISMKKAKDLKLQELELYLTSLKNQDFSEFFKYYSEIDIIKYKLYNNPIIKFNLYFEDINLIDLSGFEKCYPFILNNKGISYHLLERKKNLNQIVETIFRFDQYKVSRFDKFLKNEFKFSKTFEISNNEFFHYLDIFLHHYDKSDNLVISGFCKKTKSFINNTGSKNIIISKSILNEFKF